MPVHILPGPDHALAVLAHLQSRGGDSARVRRLARGEKNSRILEYSHTFGDRGHVGAFSHEFYAVLDQVGGIDGVNFILGRAGKGAVGPVVPYLVVSQVGIESGVYRLRILFHVLGNPAPEYVLQLEDEFQLFFGNTFLVVDMSGRVRERDDPGPFLNEFLNHELSYVTRSRYQAGLSCETLARGGQHFLGEIGATVACGFRPDKRTAPFHTFAGQNAGKLVLQALVLTEHVADLPAAHADIARGHIGELAYVAAEFYHEALAEIHDFHIALTMGIEV